jgi:hypothetical protein
VAETVVRHARCQVLTIGARAAVPEPVSAGPGQRAAPEAEASGCLVCGRASDGLVCDPCKGLIRAEAAYRLMQDEKAERR